MMPYVIEGLTDFLGREPWWIQWLLPPLPVPLSWPHTRSTGIINSLSHGILYSSKYVLLFLGPGLNLQRDGSDTDRAVHGVVSSGAKREEWVTELSESLSSWKMTTRHCHQAPWTWPWFNFCCWQYRRVNRLSKGQGGMGGGTSEERVKCLETGHPISWTFCHSHGYAVNWCQAMSGLGSVHEAVFPNLKETHICVDRPPPGTLLFAPKISIERNEPYLLPITMKKPVGVFAFIETMYITCRLSSSLLVKQFLKELVGEDC